MTTWRSINSELQTLDEEKVLQILNQERQGEKRSSILKRLHQRYNTLRVSRERIELLKEAKKP